MKITKFEHSCLLVEEGDARIIIDPGKWSDTQNAVEHIHAIVITHKHSDHCDPTSIQAILAGSPEAVVYTNEEVSGALVEAGISSTVVQDGDVIDVQGVSIEVFGKEHAQIYNEPTSIAHNVGYMIAGRFFYGGDNVTFIPPKPVEILALPVAGPWIKISMAIDFAKQVRPKVAFNVHDGFIKQNAAAKHPQKFLPEDGIEFIIPELGVPMEF